MLLLLSFNVPRCRPSRVYFNVPSTACRRKTLGKGDHSQYLPSVRYMSCGSKRHEDRCIIFWNKQTNKKYEGRDRLPTCA